jgi:nicotinate-nucleotide adenylyltransferase
MPRRIGVFGGTFDPPHIGHLVTAIDVRDALGLDEVLMVVANEPWQKVGTRQITSSTDRLAMVAAAVADVPGVRASDVEIRRGGRSYTVDTLAALAEAEPSAERFLVLGSDAAAGLETWERADELDELCRIVVVERPGSTTELPSGFKLDRVRAPRLEVSSTELRARVARGQSLRFLIPDAVVSLIDTLGLYRDEP